MTRVESPDAEYWTLDVALDPASASAREAVANFLWEAGAVGVVEELDGPAPGLRAFFPPAGEPSRLHRAAVDYLEALRSLGVPVGPGVVAVRPLRAEPWADAWRAHFRPVPVGRRLLVCPPWAVPGASGPDPGRLTVVVEPGRAFGTGGHATTRGCLELLERALDGAPAMLVLDVGTGSGILAIAAARLGVPDVTAIDLDPDAVAATRSNAERNGVAGRLRAEVADVLAWDGPPADLVLANLLGTAHVAHAAVLGGRVSRRGRLIAGGLLAHEVPAVVGAYVPEGFALAELVEHEGWASVCLARAVP